MFGNRKDHFEGADLDVAIIGAGVGGLYALYKMREQLNLNAQAFDMASGVGGTWFWNRYPGCRVDTESTVYTYSFDLDMFQNWEWSERYARQSEVLAYLNAVADKHDLKRSINFNTKIEQARWDESINRWILTSSDGKITRARYLIEAVGLLSSSYAPEFADQDKFKGQILVASKWPEISPKLAGKRVAVVGTGSTGIQVITAIASEVGELHVLQRTPQWVVPLGIGPFPQKARDRIKLDPLGYRNWALNTGAVFGFVESTTPALAVSDEERKDCYERAWQKGNGFSFMMETFADITVTAAANKTATDFIKSKIDDVVLDPKVAEMLTPTDYYARRPLAADGYYETFNQPNVTLHNVKENPIERYTEKGLIVGGKEIELDVVILATGFDAMTGNYLKIDTIGRGDMKLRDVWKDGPRSYCGMTVAGFPNFFMVFGPFSPFTSQPLVHEWQVDYFSDLIRAAETKNLIVDTADEAQDAWVKICQEGLAGTLFQVTDSWINGANIPGKPRTSMWYMGGMANYMVELNDIQKDNYRGFVLSPPTLKQAMAETLAHDGERKLA
ncbi:cation diffusion facilitator CzcD-associated flavoprotein CzcO [Ochrobactrum daejeonense]|uniref:Cation diffusion facilitator CzcD-associated flavoprotein CzcO n=1 Tax=Brucella daejeonensis TaxID=659015 RepID=A0A7W9ENH5_9HYPH|nr:NAD(P)/FAD-dependent oxidoreductase [Brucella daejeonensis]MBB5704487.1 cation diffusion facilitator CzcD-associated flavoprotein CzcO [Brucella daejeonensis]